MSNRSRFAPHRSQCHAGTLIPVRGSFKVCTAATPFAFELRTQCQEAGFVGAHQVHHALAVVEVPMKPNAAVEGEAHPLAAACEFPVGRV